MATLNLHNPEGLYSGGSVHVNALPYARLAMEARDRKQAREDAIDKYYQKLPDTINDKGLRDQEIPIINEYKDKIFEFGLKNKEALRNPKLDKGAAQFQLQKLMRDAQGVARESQNAAKTDLELGKLWFNKENQWALSNDDFIKQHDSHNLPVTDPNYKKMDLANVMSKRPFDQDKFVKQIKTQFPYSEQISRTTDPTNPLYDIVTTNPILDQKTKEGIYDFAADKLHNDYTFANKIKKDLAGTGQLPRLQEISKEVFGKNIESDEDVAAAYTVSQMYRPQTKEKSQTDVNAVMDKRAAMANAEWDRRNKITYGQSMKKIAANKAAGQVPEYLGYVSDEVVSEYGVPLQSGKTFVDITNVDPERLDIITNRDLSKKKIGVQPVEINMTQPDGSLKRMKGYYVDPSTGDWEGKGAQKVSREAAKDRYIQSKAGTKFKAQSGTKGSENTNKHKKIIVKQGELNDLR